MGNIDSSGVLDKDSCKFEYEKYLDRYIWKSEGLFVLPYNSRLKDGTDVHHVTNGNWDFHIKDDKMVIHSPKGYVEKTLDNFSSIMLRDLSIKEASLFYYKIMTYEEFSVLYVSDAEFDAFAL